MKLDLQIFILLLLLAMASSCTQKQLRLEDLDLSKVRQRSGNAECVTPETGDSIRMGGVTFKHGLRTVAESIFEIDLNGQANHFSAVAGIGEESKDTGSVVFHIYADGAKIWTSGMMSRNSANQTIDLDMKGIQRIVFYVEEEDIWDHIPVYWADAQFTGVKDPSMIKPYIEEAEILTPSPAPEPRINSAKVFGVRPGSPFLFTIAATGDRPMTFSAENLPKGLSLNSENGQITGKISKRGTYPVLLKAINNRGESEWVFKIICGDLLDLTPQMGWNSYNIWGCANADEQKISEIADAFVSSGLINYGWTYVNIDCGWSGNVDPKTLRLMPNEHFQDMSRLVDYIHSHGLKAGIYSTPWTHGYDGRKGASANTLKREYLKPTKPGDPSMVIGEYYFEDIDAKQYSEWGFDYLKYDWYPNDVPAVKRMADALKKQDRDIIYSLSNDALIENAEAYATLSNSWRTTDDINDTWGRMTQIGFNEDEWKKYGGPGHWNDADMLVVGDVGWDDTPRHTKLTPNEQYTHISLWSMLSSPLLIGCDLRNLDDFTLSLLTNAEVIEVNQDPLGLQASPVSKKDGKEIWVKEMEDGSKVVGLFNRTFFESEMTASWKMLGINGNRRVHDLWRQKDLGDFNKEYSTIVPRHGVIMVRLFPE